MKNLLMAFAVMAFILTSCGSKQQSSEMTHKHSDGSVHEGHDHNDHEHVEVKQEAFEVTTDSTATKTDSKKEEGCDQACGGCEHAH